MAFAYGELDALTEKYYLPVLVDQIFEGDEVLKKIYENKKVVQGGKQFTVPVKIDGLNRGIYGANQQFPNTKKEIANTVDVPVGGYFTELVSDGFEEAQNNGQAAVKNLLEEKLKDMEEAMRQNMLDALYRPKAAGGFTGLQDIIHDKNTLYGLDRLSPSHDYWKSIVKEDAAAGVSIDGDAGYQVLRKFFMDVTGGGSEAKNLMFVGDFSTVNKIEFMLASRNQITTVNEKEANLGFTSFRLFGRPILGSHVLEEIAEASGKGILYAINLDFMSLHTLTKNDFRMTKFKEDQKNDLRIKQLMVEGNFVATKPKRMGVIKDILI